MSLNQYEVGQHDTRPWGEWEVIAVGDGYAVKRIRVSPGGLLSLQSHRHRAEHWVVVAGVARATLGEAKLDLRAGQSIDIPVGEKHRVENPGSEDAVFIEVQRGDVLQEADIERFSDVYGRAT